MPNISRKVGRQSQIITVDLRDSSTGAGITTLAYNTSGLSCYYKKSDGTASVAVALVDIPTLGTFISGGFKAVDTTNMPGVYEFHIPNAALASGDSVAITFKGTGVLTKTIIIELTAIDNQDSTSGGISRLDTAVSVGHLDLANGVETGLTVRQLHRALLSFALNNVGVVGNTSNFKRLDGSTTAWSVDSDANGNRTNSTKGTV